MYLVRRVEFLNHQRMSCYSLDLDHISYHQSINNHGLQWASNLKIVREVKVQALANMKTKVKLQEQSHHHIQ